MIPPPPTIPIKFTNFGKERFPKKQIFLHFTVSLSAAHRGGRTGHTGDVAHWERQSYPLGTFCIIDSDGKVYQLFNSSQWANHLGIKRSLFAEYGLPNLSRKITRESVGIELDSLGPLEPAPDGNGFWTAVPTYQKSKWIRNVRVAPENVTHYPDGWKGWKYMENFHPEQIESLRQMLLYLCYTYSIPCTYHEDMWDVSPRALQQLPGIWQHVSVRKSGKSDLHPQTELVDMLKGLQADYDRLTAPPAPPPPPPKPAPLPDIPLIFTNTERDKRQSAKDAALWSNRRFGTNFKI